MRRFEGKVALVTGVASGIGRASALRFASEGAAVYGIDVKAVRDALKERPKAKAKSNRNRRPKKAPAAAA